MKQGSHYQLLQRQIPRLLLPGLLLLVLSCPAQLLPIRNYTTKEGLSSNNVYAILRDTRGILWVGTNNGVNCYDGDRFFQPSINARSGQIYVTNFIEDHENNIWITSWYNGIYKYRNGRFTNYLPDSAYIEAQANNTFDLLEWAPGRYVVGSDKNVWLFDDQDGRPGFRLLDPANTTLDQQIGCVVKTTGGDLLIGYGKGVARYTLKDSAGQQKWVYAGMLWEGPYVNRIAMMDGHAWLGTDGGLYYFPRLADVLKDPVHNKPILLYSGIEVDRVYIDNEKNIWFTGGGGAHKISGDNYRTPDSVNLSRDIPSRIYSRSNGLPSNNIRAFCSDAEGVTWLGTEDGLARLGQEYYHFYPIQEAAPDALNQKEDAIIISIHDDQQGNLWMGSYIGLYEAKKGMSKTDAMTEQTTVGKKKMGFVNCLVRDNKTQLWACTASGILLIDGDRSILKDSLVARCAFADQEGKIWFGGKDGNVVFEQNGKFHELKHPAPNKERIDAIYRDPGGNIWVGHALTGLRKFRIEGDSLRLLQEYTINTGFSNLRVRSLNADGKGHLLAGTRTDGLYIIPIGNDDTTRPIHITVSQGLSGNWVKAATAAKEGFYLATNNGLDLLEADDKGDFHHARIHPVPFRNEQVPIELNALYLQSDTLWLGTGKGLLQYILRRQGKNMIAPPVYFMKVTINGRLDSSFLPFTQTGELPSLHYEQNNLAFDFAGLSFRDEGKVSYRYKMEGLDKDWSMPTSRRYVNYSHLSPGFYKLFVMARNDDGVWSTVPAALSFRIEAPFWLQGWFITLCAMVLAALIYLLYRYRLQQALKIERLRTKISTDLHDDIGSTLSSISIMSEMILHSPGGPGQPPTNGTPAEIHDRQRMAGEIKENSLSLMDKMDDIVWSINPRNDEVENLMVRIQRFAAPLFEAKGMDYEISIENNIRHLKLSMEHRQHVYLIMKEAINNLVKYSRAAKTTIRALSVTGSLKVEISDDGIGFVQPSAGSGSGNGIVNMKSRAALMRAALDIDSAPGKGTTVVLTLKIK